MNNQNALSFIESLLSRDIEIALHDEKLRIIPASSLTLEDRQFIKTNRDKLIALVRGGHQTGRLPDGWQHDEAMPERVILVHGGRLTDSCLFRTKGAAAAFLVLIAHGLTSNQAFHAACAIEDGETDEAVLSAILEDES